MHYGPVMIDIQGVGLDSKERDLLKHPGVGGVLLFKRNYIDKETLKNLVADIRNTAQRPVLIAVDHEGGCVWRFREGFTVLNPAKDYGTRYDKDPVAAKTYTEHCGYTMASELLACGIDLSFAPVLDLDRGISEVIVDRAFHANPNIVAELAGSFIAGMNRAGMAATGKHFPGHGGIRADSHIKESIDTRSLEALMAEDLIPFIQLKDKLKGIMPAHIVFPLVDSVPTGFSNIWLQDILRHKIGYQGAIISDCLSMKGAAIGGDYVLRSRMALDAGCDMVIMAQQDHETLHWVLDKLERVTGKESQQRLSGLAGNFQNTQTIEKMAAVS